MGRAYAGGIRVVCVGDFLAEHHSLKSYLDDLPDQGRPEFVWRGFVVERFGEAGIKVLGRYDRKVAPSDGHYASCPVADIVGVSCRLEIGMRKVAFRQAKTNPSPVS